MPSRVIVCDELAPEAYEILEQHGLGVEQRVGLSGPALLDAVRGADALLVRSATKVTREVIDAAGPSLRVIGRAGVGVDNVDCDAATDHGVVVMNAPSGNTTTTAELAIALLCALARHIPRASRVTRAGSWKKGGLLGTELAGKTLGVIGLGRIGRAVAERGLGLKLSVLAHDPYLQGSASPLQGVELASLDELLARSDFVTLHVPLNDSTRHLLSRERIARMKAGARVINAARGGLVDEAALLEALESGRLRGAALDVLEQEPPRAGHPLLERDDVIVTPHLGASSDEAQKNVAVEIAEQVCEFLLEGVARNAVNAPAVSAQTMREIAPYIQLAEKLGSFLAQIGDEPVRALELSLSGEIARTDASHVKLALLVGVLKHALAGSVNFVNAPRLAQERGLRLSEVPDDQPHFLQSLVTARSFGRTETHRVAGSVFGREPRLVLVDDVPLELAPRGPLLVTRHADQPGVVGLLGTLLGRHGVNIRRLELGPAEGASGLAMGFLSLYEEPALEVVEELRRLEPIRDVRLIHF
jgi:D-3-phosphoglycerate dehydrogenase / 2-oxoglutarate reductase